MILWISIRDLHGPSRHDSHRNHVRVCNNSECTPRLSAKSNSNQNVSSIVGSENHPSVTFISTQRSAAFWLLPAIPTLVIHQPREIAICQGRFVINPHAASKIAFLHFLEGGGDEFKPGTSATYSWSSVLFLFCAFLHQNENRMIRVSKLHSVDAMCATRSLPSFPKCFRERLSLSSGGIRRMRALVGMRPLEGGTV